jgi:hypothetical protein
MTTNQKDLAALNRRLFLLLAAARVTKEGIPREEREVVTPHVSAALSNLAKAHLQLREAVESWGVRPQQSIEVEGERRWGPPNHEED